MYIYIEKRPNTVLRPFDYFLLQFFAEPVEIFRITADPDYMSNSSFP